MWLVRSASRVTPYEVTTERQVKSQKLKGKSESQKYKVLNF